MKDFELFEREYHEENKDKDKDKDIELFEAFRQADKLDSGMYHNGAFKAYISKKVDDKYINQFVRLNDNILIQKISFSYIDNLLNQINTYSKITKKELLQGVFDTSIKENIDDYFFVKNENQKGAISLCQQVSFYNLSKKVKLNNNHQEFYFNKITFMVLEYSKHIAKYLEYQNCFWNLISQNFSERDLISLCEELFLEGNKCGRIESNLFKILRILSFAHFSKKNTVITYINNNIKVISVVTNKIKEIINSNQIYTYEIYAQELLLDLHFDQNKFEEFKKYLDAQKFILDTNLSKESNTYKEVITKLEDIFHIPDDFSKLFGKAQ